ncbi:tetraspanin family protein [Flavobacterium sp. ZT3R18]|uniref:tetraspanin family protein n=1 Tax=Flavobacterium sp. ZT3R18 TaxID=2594429 RepID=UPI0011798C67|nr:tetraspanin family protein [Flavobacterium sp. ZT3R18]TRX36465.1 tetraspanin family protein [Flavobacterium sp. ZT3R18]
MKKTLIFLILLLFTAKGFSQTIPSTEFSKEDYLQKSKTQKTTGWVFLSAGVAITIVGVIGFSNTYDDWSDNSTDTYGVLILSGPLIALGSIPFFISSGSNARKAATLSLNYQPILIPNQGSLVQSSQPSLSIAITF